MQGRSLVLFVANILATDSGQLRVQCLFDSGGQIGLGGSGLYERDYRLRIGEYGQAVGAVGLHLGIRVTNHRSFECVLVPYLRAHVKYVTGAQWFGCCLL